MLPLVSKALTHLFNATSPFLTVRAMDVMFDGIGINCDTNEFSVKAVCSTLQGEVSGIKIINDTYYEISLFGAVCFICCNLN